MLKYDLDDIVTYWFVVVKNKYGKQIQGYSDNKEIVKFYIEFHKCKNYEIKKMTSTVKEIYKIIEENVHDEIQLCNISIRDPKDSHKVKLIQVPATETEMNFIREESNSFLLSAIPYSYLSTAIPYLKNKYQQAMNAIFLKQITDFTIYNKHSKFIENIGFDQLKIMLKLFPDNFR